MSNENSVRGAVMDAITALGKDLAEAQAQKDVLATALKPILA